jgi:lipoprotein signal peptidase
VDYFEMFPKNGSSGTGWFIFNIPDFYITGGIFFTCGAFIIVFIIQMINDKKNSKVKKGN